MKINTILSTLFVLLYLGACTPKPEQAIAGKWRNENLSFEFFPDTTVISSSGTMTPLRGKYSSLSNGHFKMEVPRTPGSTNIAVFHLVVEKDNLTITYESGKKSTLQRIR